MVPYGHGKINFQAGYGLGVAYSQSNGLFVNTNGELGVSVSIGGGLGVSPLDNGLQVDKSGTSYLLTSGSATITGGTNTVNGDLEVNTSAVAAAIAGAGITYNQSNGTLEAAPGYISSVDNSFAVDTNGQLSLSDAISITSVELTDTVSNVTAASDVFGNASTTAYAPGSANNVVEFASGTKVVDVLVTITSMTGDTRTSKLTGVFTGGDAPTWTEYGIVNSGSAINATIEFNSEAGASLSNMTINVAGMPTETYAVHGVVTLLK